jgi:hypothetical protein
LTGHIFGAAELFRVLADASAAHVLNAHDEREFFFSDAVLVINEPAGIGHRDRLGITLNQFLYRILRGVTSARDSANLAFNRFITRLQHFLGEINSAVTCGLRAHE